MWFKSDLYIKWQISITMDGWIFIFPTTMPPISSFAIPVQVKNAARPGWKVDSMLAGFVLAGYKIKDVGEGCGCAGSTSSGLQGQTLSQVAFEDQTQSLGLDQVLHTMGSNYGDVINDGYPDFYLGTGDPDLATLIPNPFLNQEVGDLPTSPLQPVWDISKKGKSGQRRGSGRVCQHGGSL